MGWFFGKRRLSSEALRDALIDAAEVSDDGELKKLIAKHRDDIRTHFPSWTTVPEPIRGDAAQRKRYVEGLIAVANHFKSVLDDRSLLARMTGPPAANPLIKWEQRLRMADEAMAAGKYREAEAALLEQMAAVRGVTGTGTNSSCPSRSATSLSAASTWAGWRGRAPLLGGAGDLRAHGRSRGADRLPQQPARGAALAG